VIDFVANNPYLVIALILIASTGIAVFFVGYLAAMIYSFSDGIWWGLGVLFIPFFIFYYCYRFYPKTLYAIKLLVLGILIELPVAPFIYYALK
jgi:hypothetical protein